MINPATFIGEPQYFKDICRIYPPKIKDVVANTQFSIYNKILTISQEDLDDEARKNKKNPDDDIERITPFECLLSCSYHNPAFRNLAKEAFEFFTHEKVDFLYSEKVVVFGGLGEGLIQAKNLSDLRLLKEEDYFAFQNAIRKSFGAQELKEPEPFDPKEDPRIRRMKEKIRERDRIKAKQAAEGKGNGISLSTTLVAICCMGIGITPLNIGELSYAAITPIMNMMQEKEKYDIDIRSLLAGADSKKIKPKYWIRNSD